jgi:hypothetical protein
MKISRLENQKGLCWVSQDEQFRLQNQTLMQELTVLVQTNEQLENQLASSKSSPPSEPGNEF